jgi:hypothetical protein
MWGSRALARRKTKLIARVAGVVELEGNLGEWPFYSIVGKAQGSTRSVSHATPRHATTTLSSFVALIGKRPPWPFISLALLPQTQIERGVNERVKHATSRYVGVALRQLPKGANSK